MAALLLSASIFLVTLVSCIRYVKVSRILLPAYHKLPEVTQAQIEASTNRHITHDQCQTIYPGLYECVQTETFSKAGKARADRCRDTAKPIES